MDEYVSPLRKWRMEHKISAHKVSVLAGVDPNTISRFERSGNINAYNLCRIADGINVTTDFLLGRAQENSLDREEVTK